jgi:hypothetical protein
MFGMCIYPVLSLIYQTNQKTMIKAFKVYKEGRTTDWITILIPKAEFNDITLQFKLDKFTYLGYQIEMI